MYPATFALQLFAAEIAQHARNVNLLAENGSADAALELLRRVNERLRREWADHEAEAYRELRPQCKEFVDLCERSPL